MCLGPGGRGTKTWQGGGLSEVNPWPVVVCRVMDHLKHGSPKQRAHLEPRKMVHWSAKRVGPDPDTINPCQRDQSRNTQTNLRAYPLALFREVKNWENQHSTIENRLSPGVFIY